MGAYTKHKNEKEVQEREEIILFLLEQGVEVHHEDNFGRDLLYLCKYYGFKNAQNAILMKMQNMINDENTQMFLLSYLRNGYIPQAEKLIDSGIKAGVDEGGNNALHALCRSGKSESIHLMRQILEQKSDCLNAKNKEGSTPIIESARYAYKKDEKEKKERVKIISFLLEQGAEIHHKDGKEWTLLHHVCATIMSIDIVQSLIDNGADINVKTENGRTPIMVCGKHGAYDSNEKEKKERVKIILFLLEQGAETHHKDKDGDDLPFLSLYS